jgi:C-terminal processing protease CtpA/Prc
MEMRRCLPVSTGTPSPRSVIIDLRGNGGGAIETLTSLTGSFTDQPPEMAKRVGRDKTETVNVKAETPRITGPVFVTVGSESASASEMFARDLQIRKRVVVIGDNSSGRVNVAQIFWETVGAFDLVAFGTEIAVAKVVMEDGEELENRGVKPDEFCIPNGARSSSGKGPVSKSGAGTGPSSRHSAEIAHMGGGSFK